MAGKVVRFQLDFEKNVIVDAIGAILFRTQGAEDMPASRLDALQKNLSVMFPKASVVVFLVLAVIWMILLLRGHEKISQIKKMTPVLLVAVYPIVWYLVLSNHSQIHSYFTYRTLEITVFAVLAFLFMCVKWKKTGEENG